MLKERADLLGTSGLIVTRVVLKLTYKPYTCPFLKINSNKSCIEINFTPLNTLNNIRLIVTRVVLKCSYKRSSL